MSATWEPDLVPAELVALTRALGEPARDLVILAEGNTSALLPDGRVVVEASGTSMAAVTAEDFVVVDVEPLVALVTSREASQEDLSAALDAGEHAGRRRRASIETLVHVAAQAFALPGTSAAFIGHTHPTEVVGLLSSTRAATAWERHVYSDEAVVVGHPLFVPYAPPGLALGRAYHQGLARHVREHGALPALVLLGNHGIVVNAPSPAGVEAVSAMAVKGARVRLAAHAAGGVAPLDPAAVEVFFARDDIAERRAHLAGGP